MNATLPQDFASWFAFQRRDRKISRQHLADLADLSVKVIDALEREGRIPHYPDMLALATALDPDPPAAETLHRAGYVEEAAAALESRVLVPESVERSWSRLPARVRKLLDRLSEVPARRRWRGVELVAAVLECWLQTEAGLEGRQ